MSACWVGWSVVVSGGNVNVKCGLAGALAKLLRGDSRTNILSEPSIVTLDNKEATIKKLRAGASNKSDIGGVLQVVSGQGDGWVRGFEAQNGVKLWEFDTNPKDAVWPKTRNELIATPVIANDRVYIGNGQDPEYGEGVGNFYAIDATKRGDITISGKAWQAEKIRRTISTAAVADGLVYIADFSGFLRCLDEKTGQEIWMHDLFAAVWGSPFVVDGKVYITDEDGELLRLEDFLPSPEAGPEALHARNVLLAELELAIGAARVAEQRVGLVFVDLDTFKEVNDTLGIATADRLLIEVRNRLAALLPDRAQLLRFTGDQFAILLTGAVDEDIALGFAETIRTEFDTPITSEDVSLVLGASIGVALFPDHAERQHASNPDVEIRMIEGAPHGIHSFLSSRERYVDAVRDIIRQAT